MPSSMQRRINGFFSLSTCSMSVLSLVLNVLEGVFGSNWDMTVTHFNLPTGGGGSYKPASDPPRHSIKMQHKEIAKLFPQSYGLSNANFSPHLTLPPNTNL